MIKQRISHLVGEYCANLGTPKEANCFEAHELEGIPQFVFDKTKAATRDDRIDDKLKVTSDPCFIGSVQRFALNSDTREHCSSALPNRCMDNALIIKEVLVLRDKASRLLGFSNHAQLRLQDRIVQTPEVANVFVDDLQARVKRGGAIKLARLNDLKTVNLSLQEDCLLATYFTLGI